MLWRLLLLLSELWRWGLRIWLLVVGALGLTLEGSWEIRLAGWDEVWMLGLREGRGSGWRKCCICV